MLSLTRLVVLIVVFASLARCAGEDDGAEESLGERMSVCHNAHDATPSDHASYVRTSLATEQQTLAYLYGVCARNEKCARAYHLGQAESSHENDLAAFEYQTRHWMRRRGATRFLAERCRAVDVESAREQLWLDKMRLEAYEAPIVNCGSNERFVYVPAKQQGECICADDHNCAERGNLENEPMTLSTVALTLVSLVAIVHIVVRIVASVRLARLARHLQRRLDAQHTPEATAAVATQLNAALARDDA